MDSKNTSNTAYPSTSQSGARSSSSGLPNICERETTIHYADLPPWVPTREYLQHAQACVGLPPVRQDFFHDAKTIVDHNKLLVVYHGRIFACELVEGNIDRQIANFHKTVQAVHRVKDLQEQVKSHFAGRLAVSPWRPSYDLDVLFAFLDISN
ncbi:hypothetical protein DM02DRAFT_625039 [Periconia macrospinosa]|uniref:Uncharacterized protein n=1 Tax=Periconia macrospinosa TaxID=97972 RepID=A0A2V1E4P8_9PLEO|nr:hypothetical protein DM02DRAFT_625039 [Periconia macrospinosa]